MAKHPGGRPFKYKTATALQEGIEKYFADCQGEVLRKEYTEGRLFDKDGARGAQFSLRNNFQGWRDGPEEKTGEVQIVDDL